MQSFSGKKVGMTQVFNSDNKVVPVTVIDCQAWYVLQKKTVGHDGYNALQIGCLKERHRENVFSVEWLKSKKQYFSVVCEIRIIDMDSYEIGQEIFPSFITAGSLIDATGVTIGKGFQGGVKRHGFSGGKASHGDKLGRKCGSLSGLRTCGRVFKGKRMPGQTGAEICTIKNLEIVKVDIDRKIILIKGAVPGKIGSALQFKSR